MSLSVTSEVGRLMTVLCHAPGREVDGMIPDMMEELLFDDILHGVDAREEHGRLRRVLELLGVEVLEAQKLLAEALEQDEGARKSAVAEYLSDASDDVRDAAASDASLLADLLVGGRRTSAPDVTGDLDDIYAVAPLPNYCFQRDPQIVIGSGVVHSMMCNRAREREADLGKLIFQHHPRFKASTTLFDPNDLDARARRLSALEGGDLLVLDKDILVVGRSERTNTGGVSALCDALGRGEDRPRWLIVVEIPQRRAFMHLDTLFTQVDEDACLIYPPVLKKGGALNPGVFLIDLHQKERAYVEKSDLLSTLKALGKDLQPIYCGGDDPVMQQREQWTDGANSMALAPGVITVYDRNPATLEELSRHGFATVDAEDLLLGRTELSLDAVGRAAILMPSNELSRARGGPHCLLHPLTRA